MTVSFSKPPAALSRYLASEPIILVVVWAGHLVAAPFSYPPIGLDGEGIFYSFYFIFQAYLIAFPLASLMLKRQRFVSFLIVAAIVILAFAAADEYLIETFIFRDDAMVWFGVVYSASQAVTVTLFVLTLKYFWRHHADQRRIEQLARTKAEHELAYLKAQIHPHILFNELNNIYAHALQKSEETPNLILMLSDILRYMIYDSAQEQVAIDAEIGYLRKYIELQRIALGDRGVVSFTATNETSGKLLPPFLLMPFVENCFKHAMGSLERNITIDINITAQKDMLVFTCENNFDALVDAASVGGVGLPNVRRRLELLFKDQFSLKVKDKEQSYRVELRIPLQ